MEQASFACPQIHWACRKKLPEREEQRFHKNPFAVILIVEVLGLSFVCFYLFLWHYFVAGGSSPNSLLLIVSEKTNCFSFILPEPILKSTVYLGIVSTPSHLLSLIVTDSPPTLTDWPEKKGSLWKDYEVCHEVLVYICLPFTSISALPK